MTSADPNDLAPAQEKLEWVTPKISLMGAGDTESKTHDNKTENGPGYPTTTAGISGPS